MRLSPVSAKQSGASFSPDETNSDHSLGTTPKWNFYKYLISREGKVVESYSSLTSPENRGFIRDVEKALGPQ